MGYTMPMTNAIENTICTNIKWLGRAHCGKCHIRHLMLFAGIPDSAFDKVLQPIDHHLFQPGTVIYEAGTQKQFIYSIRRGLVKLTHITQDGTYRIVRLLGPGAAIGLELLDDVDSYHYTAVAIDQVDLCKIPIPTIRKLENLYPLLYERVALNLQEQLDLADQWIVTLGAGTAKQRVAQLILFLHKNYPDKNGNFIMLNGEDMAAMLGIATETVSRVIAEFKRQKLLLKTHGKLYSHDDAGLREIAGPDYKIRPTDPQHYQP